MKETLGSGNSVNRDAATEQWWKLANALHQEHVPYVFLDPVHERPDLVFTANAGLMHPFRKTVLLSKFRFKERRGESPIFEKWFRENGYQIEKMPKDAKYYFEGAGDALYVGQNWLVAGYGFRTTLEGAAWATQFTDVDQSLILKLVDPRFYHLDTCFCPLGKETVMYYPGAFDEKSQNEIEKNFRTIRVSEEDAKNFVCNAVPIRNKSKKTTLIMTSPSQELRKKLSKYTIQTLDMSEFLKSGGGPRCLVLFI